MSLGAQIRQVTHGHDDEAAATELQAWSEMMDHACDQKQAPCDDDDDLLAAWCDSQDLSPDDPRAAARFNPDFKLSDLPPEPLRRVSLDVAVAAFVKKSREVGSAAASEDGATGVAQTRHRRPLKKRAYPTVPTPVEEDIHPYVPAPVEEILIDATIAGCAHGLHAVLDPGLVYRRGPSATSLPRARKPKLKPALWRPGDLFLRGRLWYVVAWYSQVASPATSAYESLSTCIEWPEDRLTREEKTLKRCDDWAKFIAAEMIQAEQGLAMPLGFRHQTGETFLPSFCLLPADKSTDPEVLYDYARRYDEDRKAYDFKSAIERAAETDAMLKGAIDRSAVPVRRKGVLAPVCSVRFERANVATNITPGEAADETTYLRLIEHPAYARRQSYVSKKYRKLIHTILERRKRPLGQPSSKKEPPTKRRRIEAPVPPPPQQQQRIIPLVAKFTAENLGDALRHWRLFLIPLLRFRDPIERLQENSFVVYEVDDREAHTARLLSDGDLQTKMDSVTTMVHLMGGRPVTRVVVILWLAKSRKSVAWGWMPRSQLPLVLDFRADAKPAEYDFATMEWDNPKVKKRLLVNMSPEEGAARTAAWRDNVWKRRLPIALPDQTLLDTGLFLYARQPDGWEVKVDRDELLLYIGMRLQVLTFANSMRYDALLYRPGRVRSFFLQDRAALVKQDLFSFFLFRRAFLSDPSVYVHGQLVSTWAQAEKNLFVQRLSVLPLAIHAKLFAEFITPSSGMVCTVHDDSTQRAFMQLYVNSTNDLTPAMRETFYKWIGVQDKRLAKWRRDGSQCAQYVSISHVTPKAFQRYFGSALYKYPHYKLDSKHPFDSKRCLTYDSKREMVFGDGKLVSRALASYFSKVVMPIRTRRNCECDVPAEAEDEADALEYRFGEGSQQLTEVAPCKVCLRFVRKTYGKKKFRRQIGRTVVSWFVSWLRELPLEKEYQKLSKLDVLQLSKFPPEHQRPIADGLLPPCMRGQTDPLLADVFQLGFRRDGDMPFLDRVRQTHPSHEKELMKQLEVWRNRVFGTRTRKAGDVDLAPWTCESLCATNRCPVRAEVDDGVIDLQYRQRCRDDHMRRAARDHLGISYDTADEERAFLPGVGAAMKVTAVGGVQYLLSRAIETPVDYSVNLMLMKWQRDDPSYLALAKGLSVTSESRGSSSASTG